MDFAHVADSYKEPLFVYPSSDHPSAELKDAYAARNSSRKRYEEARKEREALELETATKLGRLHNLMRESHERERKAKRALRQRTNHVYEAEMQEAGDNCEFNDRLVRLKAYAKKHKGLPASLLTPERKGDDNGDTTKPEGHGETNATAEDEGEARELAEWVRGRQRAYEQSNTNNDDDASTSHPSSIPPHHLAALENAGVPLSLSDEDKWHRSLLAFQRYAGEYWANPVLVQITDGDVMRSIAEELIPGTSDGTLVERRDATALRAWCSEQQERYQDGELSKEERSSARGRYARLVDSGFAFDVFPSDARWEEHVASLSRFRAKYGHVRVPEGYRPSDNVAPPASAEDLDLRGFVERVRTLLHRDALAPRRSAHLKRVGLYDDVGGRVYDAHVRFCEEGREERGEGRRVKRKFEALAVMARKESSLAPKKAVVTRGSMDNWAEKLEKLVAYKEKHDTIIDIQNDVKLRGWTYSIIRKLSINSSSLRGDKMNLIESHEGLKEYLLRKENVEAATAEIRARKSDGPQREDDDDDDDDKRELEELADDALLGEIKDEEVNALIDVKEEDLAMVGSLNTMGGSKK